MSFLIPKDSSALGFVINVNLSRGKKTAHGVVKGKDKKFRSIYKRDNS